MTPITRALGLSCALAVCGCGVDSVEIAQAPGEEAQAAGALDVSGSDQQFGGAFRPRNAPWGGFGGGACRASRTPVIFVPGNGDDAKNFDFPPSVGGDSPYDAFRRAGYTDCELFGVNWLAPASRKTPLANYHDAGKARIVADFIADVLAFTGARSVDLIGHSMGVTVMLAAVDDGRLWLKVRRVIAISAAMRGLDTCYSLGNANPLFPVCGSQNVWDSRIFGFYPSSFWAPNWRMGSSGFRAFPRAQPGTRFFSLSAGKNDGFVCTSNAFTPTCELTARFDASAAVAAQLDVGAGSTALELDLDWTDYSPYKAGGGDVDGVGHFRAKNNTGRIQVNMLTTECTGTACCAGYGAACR